MQGFRRVVSFVTATALGVGLSIVMVAPASHAATAPDRQARCAAANQDLGAKQARYRVKAKKAATSKKKITKVKKHNRKALRRATRADASRAVIAKVKKDNKKKLAKARKVHTKRKSAARSALHRLDSAKVYRAVACGQQTGDPLTPAQLTQLLQVLAGTGDGFDVEQLTELLTLLFPSQAPTLSGSDLASILAAVNADLPVLRELAALANGIGGVLTPEQLQTLIMGILDHLTALTPGHATPEQIATVLTGVLTTLTGQLGSAGVHAVGELLHLLLAGMSSADFDTLTTTGLGDLLDQLIPGVSAQLDTGQLDTLLTSVQSGTLDPQALTGLLQGTLTPDQISAILDGSGTQTQVTTVLGALLPQLDALAGGGFDLPDAAALPGVLTNLGGVLDDLVGDLLCDTLPILCG